MTEAKRLREPERENSRLKRPLAEVTSPVLFASVMLKCGKYMGKGKKVDGFSNSIERFKSWALEGKLLPYMVEDQMNKHGAIALNKSSLENKAAVVIDQILVGSMFLPLRSTGRQRNDNSAGALEGA